MTWRSRWRETSVRSVASAADVFEPLQLNGCKEEAKEYRLGVPAKVSPISVLYPVISVVGNPGAGAKRRQRRSSPSAFFCVEKEHLSIKEARKSRGWNVLSRTSNSARTAVYPSFHTTICRSPSIVISKPSFPACKVATGIHCLPSRLISILISQSLKFSPRWFSFSQRHVLLLYFLLLFNIRN